MNLGDAGVEPDESVAGNALRDAGSASIAGQLSKLTSLRNLMLASALFLSTLLTTSRRNKWNCRQ
jgi:hypothetical protein